MKKRQILIVSKTIEENPEMMSTFRGEPGWQISLVSSAEEAIMSFYARPFDVIIIGKEAASADEQKLRAVLNHCSFESIILREESDDAEELKNKISEILIAKRADAFKHIQVNDTLNVNNFADDIRIVPLG